MATACSMTSAEEETIEDMDEHHHQNVLVEENKKEFDDDDDDDNQKEHNDYDNDDVEQIAVAKPGGSLLTNSVTISGSAHSPEHSSPSLIRMESYKSKHSYDMTDDVYAFIVAAPVYSWSYVFALYVIATKYIVYGTLLSDVFILSDLGGSPKSCWAVKFFLIPVAIAMQADLMQVYAAIANVKYSEDALQISKSATYNKFLLAYLLRYIDGALSLTVNFVVMLTTDKVLSVMLNFAALHFLQDIDDVFYNLVEKGFFGDRLEHMSTVCKKISWPRRVGNEDCQKSRFITNLDSILFFITYAGLFTAYFAVYGWVNNGMLEAYSGVNSYEWVGWFPVVDDSSYRLFIQDINDSVLDVPNATLKIVLHPTLDSFDNDGLIEAELSSYAQIASTMMEDDTCRSVPKGSTLAPNLGEDSCYELQLTTDDDTEFFIDTSGMVNLAVFTFENPCEFSGEKYFFTDSSSVDIPPTHEIYTFHENDSEGCVKLNSTFDMQ